MSMGYTKWILLSNYLNIVILGVHLHVKVEISRMKKILFTREFYSGMKRIEFYPGMKFNLKENHPLSVKTYKIHYFFSVIEIRSLIC